MLITELLQVRENLFFSRPGHCEISQGKSVVAKGQRISRKIPTYLRKLLESLYRDHFLYWSCDNSRQDRGCTWNVTLSNFNIRENTPLSGKCQGSQAMMIWQSCGNPV